MSVPVNRGRTTSNNGPATTGRGVRATRGRRAANRPTVRGRCRAAAKADSAEALKCPLGSAAALEESKVASAEEWAECLAVVEVDMVDMVVAELLAHMAHTHPTTQK